MPFKMKEDGTLVQDDKGLPIFIGPDGSEKSYDPDAKAKQIAELTEKASRRGTDLEELKVKHKPVEDIEDLVAFVEQSKKNAEIVAAMADKDKENEENIQKRIAEAIKGAVNPLQTERDSLKKELAIALEGLNKAVIGNAFGRSKYAAEKLVSAALAQQLFERNFYVKDGKAIGRDENGKDIYGADGIASFDEALCKMVDASPFKDNIVKSVPGGSGTSQSETPRAPGMLTPEQAASLSPEAYIKARKEGRI